MVHVTLTKEQVSLLLRILIADDENNRENDLDREEEFEEIEAKLVCARDAMA